MISLTQNPHRSHALPRGTTSKQSSPLDASNHTLEGSFMTVEARIWQVGVIGVNSNSQFLLERFSLTSNVRVCGVFEKDRSHRGLTLPAAHLTWDQLDATKDGIDALILADGISHDMTMSAIRSGKHIVLDRPWLFSSSQLREVADQAANAGRSATFMNLRRWSTDFQAAMFAKSTGRLGKLRSVEMTSCEQAVPGETTGSPLLRQIEFLVLDQLLVLVESTVRSVFAKRLFDLTSVQESGFLAIIEFANGCTARLEIQTSTRLSLRTGWMLEGFDGSYRGDRIYVTADDGEIVDQPLTVPDLSEEPLIESLTNAWHGRSPSVPSLAEAARVVRLIELMEQSAETHQVVNC
jgi:predicted dehydrogenase